ncbi:MAG: isochorismate synthase [Planctomycetota bacterium]|nr:isochorismate synthase [Planctomycetota bacterium]
MKFDVRTEQRSGLLSAVLGKLDSLAPALTDADFPACIRVPNPQLCGWEFLNANQDLAKVAWVDRNSSNVTVGLGIAADIDLKNESDFSHTVAQCRAILKGNPHLKFYGGFSFNPSATNWDGFGAGRFILPRIILSEDTLTLTVTSAADVQQAKLDVQQMSFQPIPFDSDFPAIKSTSYAPAFDGWQSRIDEALSLIRSEVLEKIVLSRKTILKFESVLNPIQLASDLQAATHDCYVFCFNFEQGSAFVGATPERLFYRQGDRLESEVIAGTRMRGENPAADEKLAIELLTSDKDQREHDIVRKSIRQKLHQFVDHLSVDSQASILRLAQKQHLKSNVEGTLKREVDDGVLLKRLHPTPAVGGYPTDNALPEIARLEPFSRGWYAGPIGWIGSNSIHFAVAIRSGLISHDELGLFSGAGIVRGSEPAQEWQEVDNKIQDFINVLRQS